jgi:hypothetical protein
VRHLADGGKPNGEPYGHLSVTSPTVRCAAESIVRCVRTPSTPAASGRWPGGGGSLLLSVLASPPSAPSCTSTFTASSSRNRPVLTTLTRLPCARCSGPLGVPRPALWADATNCRAREGGGSTLSDPHPVLHTHSPRENSIFSGESERTTSSWASARSWMTDKGQPLPPSLLGAAKRTLHQHIREARLATLRGALPVRPPEVRRRQHILPRVALTLVVSAPPPASSSFLSRCCACCGAATAAWASTWCCLRLTATACAT